MGLQDEGLKRFNSNYKFPFRADVSYLEQVRRVRLMQLHLKVVGELVMGDSDNVISELSKGISSIVDYYTGKRLWCEIPVFFEYLLERDIKGEKLLEIVDSMTGGDYIKFAEMFFHARDDFDTLAGDRLLAINVLDVAQSQESEVCLD